MITIYRHEVRKMTNDQKSKTKKITAATLITTIIGLIAWWFGLPAPPQLPRPDTTPPPAGSSDPIQAYPNSPIIKVIDGDTIKTIDPYNSPSTINVRIIGIDTPETVHPGKPVQPYGPAATAAAKELLAETHVTLIVPLAPNPLDRYGRLLAYITMADGRDYGAIMIARGLARTTPQYPHQRTTNYKAIQDQAKQDQVGIWSKHQ
jgi:micrococcal nuclease